MMTTCLPASTDLEDRAAWPDFIGAWPRLTGRQAPEFESRHPGDESEGDQCARFGGRIGLRCMPWEWSIVRAILSLIDNEFGEKIWAHRDVVLECTRQQGKTLILVLVILWHMFKRRSRVVYTAQRWATAEDVFDRVCAVIERVPSLRRRLVAKPTKKDNRGVIRLTNGAKAEFGPRSQDFGRGYTEVDLLIHDESYDLDARETANLEGAQRAAKNPQTIMVSTPPVIDMHPKCHRLANMHRLGFARAPHLYYALYAAPREMSRDDPAAYPLAQPSYGVVGNDREMEATRQKAKTAAEVAIFDADYMGWGDYPPPESMVASEIPADRWDAMKASTPPKLINSPTVGIHRDADTGIWVITGAQYTAAGPAHLEIGWSRSATSSQVVAAVVDLVTAWNPAAVAIKGRSDAAAIEAELIKAGIEPVMVNGGKWSQYCGGFLNAAMASGLSHSDQADLNDAAASAVRHDMPSGGFVWDELAAGAAAPALCSATLAHGALLEFGGKRVRKPAAPAGGARNRSESRGTRRESNVMEMTF
jgi:hypothetical protein